MRQFAQSTIIAAAALAGVAFGGIAVSQGTQPEKKTLEKVDSGTAVTGPYQRVGSTTVAVPEGRAPAAATGLSGQYQISPPVEIQSLDGSTVKGFQIPAGTAAELMKEVDPKGPVPGDPDTGPGSTPLGICKPLITAQGMAPLRVGAEFNAKHNWKKAAGGNGWDDAKDKAINCRHEGPLRRWSCVASGCLGPGQVMPECRAQLSATGGWAKLQSGAEAKARDQWQHDSGNAHGADFKWWNKARNHDISCRHDGRKALVRQWQCVARAEPCS